MSVRRMISIAAISILLPGAAASAAEPVTAPTKRSPPKPDELIGAIVWREQPDPGPVPHTFTYRGVSTDGRVRCVFFISEAWTGKTTANGTAIDTPSALSCVNQ